MGLSMGTMICGWDKTGPALFYVDSDGSRFRGGACRVCQRRTDAADVFSVGSGSTFAYGVLDQGYHWDLSDEDALELGRRSIFAAGHRDAFSGNTLNLYHVQQDGWKFIENVDLKSACALGWAPADSRSVAIRARLRRASDSIGRSLTCAVPGAHRGRSGGACGSRAAGSGRCLSSPMHRHCRFR